MSAPRELQFPAQIPASLGRRIGAFSIDWFASLGIAVFAFREFPYGSPESMLVTTSIAFAEIVVFTFLIAASFGQKILGLQVIHINGGRLALWRIFVRTVLIFLVIPALVIDSDGRSLHDRIVGSRVVRVS